MTQRYRTCIQIILAFSIVLTTTTPILAEHEGLTEPPHFAHGDSILICLGDNAACFSATSIAFGATRPSTDGGRRSKVLYDGITVRRTPDHKTPSLYRLLASGKLTNEISVVYYANNETGDHDQLIQFKLTNVYISDIHFGGGVSDLPVEDVTFKFQEICIEVPVYQSNGDISKIEEMCDTVAGTL